MFSSNKEVRTKNVAALNIITRKETKEEVGRNMNIPNLVVS